MARAIQLPKVPAQRLALLGAMQPRVARMVEILGLHALAALLDLDASSLSEVIAGKRDLPGEIGRRVLDIDHVLARAVQVFNASVVFDWLGGVEPTFGYGRPIDMLALRGAAPLLEVLDRIEAGAHA